MNFYRKLVNFSFKVSLPFDDHAYQILSDGEEIGAVPCEIIFDEYRLVQNYEEFFPILRAFGLSLEYVVHEQIDDSRECDGEALALLHMRPVLLVTHVHDERPNCRH